MSGCHKCPAGTVSPDLAATSPSTCQKCPRGSWSPNEGAASETECLKCTPGTYNEDEGASVQTACLKCPTGTWGPKNGAESHEDCAPCAAGKYQPAVGQANSSLCINCEPGKYSPIGGVASCVACPAGTWSSGFQSTSCNICPDGQWTFSNGAMHSTDCTPCHGSRFCLGGATARVSVDILNLDLSMLSETLLTQLRSEYAGKIAEVLDLEEVTVQDLFGRAGSSSLAAARPAGGSGVRVTAFITVPQGSSTNKLAAVLYTDEFRGQMVSVTHGILGANSVAVHGSLAAPGVSINPERFTPLQETTTRAATTTEVASSSSVGVSLVDTTTTVIHHMDIQTTMTTVTSTPESWNGRVVDSFATSWRRADLALLTILASALIGLSSD